MPYLCGESLRTMSYLCSKSVYLTQLVQQQEIIARLHSPRLPSLPPPALAFLPILMESLYSVLSHGYESHSLRLVSVERTFLVALAAANCSEKPPSITAECVFLNVSSVTLTWQRGCYLSSTSDSNFISS